MGRTGHAGEEGFKKRARGQRAGEEGGKKQKLQEKQTQLKEGRRRKACFLFWLKLTAILRQARTPRAMLRHLFAKALTTE